jgi:hypothetical protein
MKLDPGIHIVKHLVFFGKSGVTFVVSIKFKSSIWLKIPSILRDQMTHC